MKIPDITKKLYQLYDLDVEQESDELELLPLNTQAVFSDETENFRNPNEPMAEDEVVISLRTARDDAEMVLFCNFSEKIPMQKRYSSGIFDIYEVVLPPEEDTLWYYFEIVKNERSYLYTKLGVVDKIGREGLFSIIRNFKTPDWAKGAVMYQIYIDRFCNGDTTNDVLDNEYIYLGRPVERITDWETPPAALDIRNFYGGDLQGIMDKLLYLKDLGVDVIYFNPIFVSPSNHKYDIQDYDYVDPHIGVIACDGGSQLVFEKFNNNYASMYIQRTTKKVNLEASNALFVKLVETAHSLDIKVILDGVFNHCGAFHKWLDHEGFYKASGEYELGAYNNEKSKYRSYFSWFEDGSYDGWWGLSNHPKLNVEGSGELCQKILDIGKKWVSHPFNADGWRLDVAADLGHSQDFNHIFWRRFRTVVKAANPNAIILAEHYGDASSWLQGNEWDTIMNYDAFMEPLSYFLTGMEKHSDAFCVDLLNNGLAFKNTMISTMSKLSVQSLQISMNQLSNHDHSRFLTRTNKKVGRVDTNGHEAANKGINKGIMQEAVLFQMTWPGAPTLYYGDEAGICGWTDPDNRRTYPWGNEDIELLEFHKAAISLHKNYPALKTGSVIFLYTGDGVISYGRFDKQDKIIVVLNNTDVVQSVVISVWQVGIWPRSMMMSIFSSDKDTFSLEKEVFEVEDGKIVVAVSAFGTLVLKEIW